MSVYKDAFILTIAAPDEQVSLALDILANGTGVVLLEGLLALRSAGGELLCEVLDPMPSAHRCANEFDVLIENAHLVLEASNLGARLPDKPRKWSVVEDYEAGTAEL